MYDGTSFVFVEKGKGKMIGSIKRIVCLVMVLAMVITFAGGNVMAENGEATGPVCSPENPEACEIAMPDSMFNDESEVVNDAPVMTENIESKVSSPKTGDFYEISSLKGANLSKPIDNKEVVFDKAEFKNVSGKLTTKANGKPKIIVISKYNCFWCDKLTEQLKTAKKEGKLSKVDVIQVNIEESSVSYDAWDYIKYVLNAYSIGTPTIIYINSQNKIVDYTMGFSDIKNSNIVDQLNAVFASDLAKYSIKYNGNGATSGTMSVQKNLKNGKKYSLSANKFKRKGYKFAGWALSKNGKVKYKNKEVVKNAAGKKTSVTLYAKWKKL